MNAYDPNLRLQLFPTTTRLETGQGGAQLTIAGLELAALVQEYGTPLYLFDRQTLDRCADGYREALEKYYPGPSGITYAGKAFLCRAVAAWGVQQKLLLDCTGAGEIHIARSGGAPPAHILVHGVNKSAADLAAAVQFAGVIVVDNLLELEQLGTLFTQGAQFPQVWLRLRPGLPVATHTYTQTGQSDSKFGMDPQEAGMAVKRCLELGLPLKGLHFHQGSHFHDPGPISSALDTALDFVQHTRQLYGWQPDTLCPGGGWGVPYHEDDLPHLSVADYVEFTASRLADGCRARSLPLPHLQLEPGRSLVAQAGVALYRVGAVKRTSGRRWLLLDGGMVDNIRPALYRARYTALPVSDPCRPDAGPAWLGGPYCESGDVLIESLPLPDLQPGELLAVPVSGAYHLSMASNYNGALKPAVVWLQQGRAHLIQKRQQLDDLVCRDLPLP